MYSITRVIAAWALVGLACSSVVGSDSLHVISLEVCGADDSPPVRTRWRCPGKLGSPGRRSGPLRQAWQRDTRN